MAKNARVFVMALRVLVAAAAVTAAVVMATSHETTTVFGITLEAKFHYTPAFTFFVIANAIGAAYNILALFVRPTSSFHRFLLVPDVVMELVLVAALSAAGALSQVGKEGNSHAGWMPICGQIPRFCDHVKDGIIASFAAVVIYFLLIMLNFRELLALII